MNGGTAIDVSAFTTALTSAVSVGDVVTLLGSVVAVGIGFVLAWFAMRKAYKMFMSAVTKGKASI